MKQLTATLNKLDPKEMRYKRARRADFDQLIAESTQVFVDGKLRIHFEVLPVVPADLLLAMQRVNYIVGWRSEGLKTQSRVFGYQPRLTIRRDFCTETSMSLDHPEEAAVFRRWAGIADTTYRGVNPELHARARELTNQVLPCWRIGDTVFTSGIVNKDNALFYHLDSGNFKDIWSAMYAISHDCAGGYLAVPELNIGFSFDRPALIMFDGQGLIHGVTPLEKRSKEAYRYSVVYYALQQMCKCGTLDEELARIRKVKTQRELKRAGKAP